MVQKGAKNVRGATAPTFRAYGLQCFLLQVVKNKCFFLNSEKIWYIGHFVFEKTQKRAF